jgi:hypothetical protein
VYDTNFDAPDALFDYLNSDNPCLSIDDKTSALLWILSKIIPDNGPNKNSIPLTSI